MNSAKGFSLIELLVVLVVVAFLAFVTVPLASGWIRNAQLEKDFAGLQRALGTAKALAMRNSTGAASEVPTAVLCRSGDNLIIYQLGVPNAGQAAACTRINVTPADDKPIYKMGQDVSITFGNNQAFCGARFTARGLVTLCDGVGCNNCTTPFDSATGLRVTVAGADNFKDPNDATKADPHDQSNTIRAF